MVDIVLGVIALVVFAIIVLRVLALPGDEDEEEAAGFVAGNWDHVKNWFDRG